MKNYRLFSRFENGEKVEYLVVKIGETRTSKIVETLIDIKEDDNGDRLTEVYYKTERGDFVTDNDIIARFNDNDKRIKTRQI